MGHACCTGRYLDCEQAFDIYIVRLAPRKEFSGEKSTGRHRTHGPMRPAMAHTRPHRPPALQNVESEAEEGDLTEWDPDAIQVRHDAHFPAAQWHSGPTPPKPRLGPSQHKFPRDKQAKAAYVLTRHALYTRSHSARTKRMRTTPQPSSAQQAKIYRCASLGVDCLFDHRYGRGSSRTNALRLAGILFAPRTMGICVGSPPAALQ